MSDLQLGSIGELELALRQRWQRTEHVTSQAGEVGPVNVRRGPRKRLLDTPRAARRGRRDKNVDVGWGRLPSVVVWRYVVIIRNIDRHGARAFMYSYRLRSFTFGLWGRSFYVQGRNSFDTRYIHRHS